MDSSAGPTTDRNGGRTTWLIGAALGVMLVVAFVAALVVLEDRQEATYAVDSPEAAFQAYIQAWDSGDTDAALAAFTPETQRRLEERDFREAARWSDEEAVRIWIDDVRAMDERATLHLTVERAYGPGLLGGDRYREDMRVTLVRQDGEWRISTPLVGYYQW